MSDIKFHWSRVPGKFLNKISGEEILFGSEPPVFNGTVLEWYETLVETIVDAINNLRRKSAGTGLGRAEVLVGEDVELVLQCSVLYKIAPNGPEVNGVKWSGVLAVSNGVNVILDRNLPRGEIRVRYFPESPPIEGSVIVRDM